MGQAGDAGLLDLTMTTSALNNRFQTMCQLSIPSLMLIPSSFELLNPEATTLRKAYVVIFVAVFHHKNHDICFSQCH